MSNIELGFDWTYLALNGPLTFYPCLQFSCNSISLSKWSIQIATIIGLMLSVVIGKIRLLLFFKYENKIADSGIFCYRVDVIWNIIYFYETKYLTPGYFVTVRLSSLTHFIYLYIEVYIYAIQYSIYDKNQWKYILHKRFSLCLIQNYIVTV